MMATLPNTLQSKTKRYNLLVGLELLEDYHLRGGIIQMQCILNNVPNK